MAEAILEVVERGYVALLNRVYQSGEAFTSNGAKYAVQVTPGGPIDERYVDFLFQPIADEVGQVMGIFVEGHDVTEQKEAETALQNTSALGEQFIAVLGHDMRNPIAAISSGVSLLRKTPRNDRATMIVDLMEHNNVRMLGLITNIMDFARGRLGGGLTVERNVAESLEPLLRHLIAETQATSTERVIEANFWLTEAVECDRGRIGQLVSNLLGNALTHGASEQPIHLNAMTVDGWFELSVENSGAQIPPTILAHIFEPFTRGAHQPNQQGLGLGLYISHEIAGAHGAHGSFHCRTDPLHVSNAPEDLKCPISLRASPLPNDNPRERRRRSEARQTHTQARPAQADKGGRRSDHRMRGRDQSRA